MLRYPYRVTVTPEEEYVGTFVDFEQVCVMATSLEQLKQRMGDALIDHFQTCANGKQAIALPSEEPPKDAHFAMVGVVVTLKVHLNNLLVENDMTIQRLAATASMTTSPDVTVLRAGDFHHNSTASSMCFALAQFEVYPEITLKAMA